MQNTSFYTKEIIFNMSNQPPYYYEVNLEWLSERTGELTAEHLPSLQIGVPPEFGGKEGIWTPEHLYVASVNSCFWATFLSIAHNSKLEFNQFRCSAKGKLEKVEGNGLQITEITLKPKLVLLGESDKEKAVRIIEKAEKNCLISNSIKTIIKLEIEVINT